MTTRQLDQQLELDAILSSDSHMCAWCAQSMPSLDWEGTALSKEDIAVCSRDCAQANIDFWSARMDITYTMSFE